MTDQECETRGQTYWTIAGVTATFIGVVVTILIA
jgi:hypothetical protein